MSDWMKDYEERRVREAEAFTATLPHAPDLSRPECKETAFPFMHQGIWAYGRKVEMRRDTMWKGMAQSMVTAQEMRERAAKLRERLEGKEGEEISEDGVFGKSELRYLLAEMDRNADAAESIGCAIRQAVMGHCEHTHFNGMDSCPFAIIVEGEPDLAPQFSKHEKHEAIGLLFPDDCKNCKREVGA